MTPLAMRASAATDPIEIPLAEKNGVYYLQAKINGSPATLMVDTGANMTFLGRKFASLASGADAPIRGIGAAKGSRVRVRLDLGTRAFMTDAMIGDFQIPDADGSLGSDVLSSCGMIAFDYERKVLVLYRKEKAA